MQTNINVQIAKQLNLKVTQVSNVLTMLDEGNTVPFISRYRKERTQNLDEIQIRDIQSNAKLLHELNSRKETIKKAISEQNLLTDELKMAIDSATSLQVVEDLYLPYKQKRRTKAMIAKEDGLQGLADFLLLLSDKDVKLEAKKYLNDEINSVDEALLGASEIIAEKVSENANHREWIRDLTLKKAHLVSVVKSKTKDLDKKGIYQQYYDFTMPLNKLSSYQVLAINRGESEKILKVDIQVDLLEILNRLRFKEIGTIKNEAGKIVDKAIETSYKRFIKPAIEREIRNEITSMADKQAIKVFGDNLYHLLMQTPIKGQVVMGFDPGFRTGCKLAVVDANGKFLTKQVIYPHKPASLENQKKAVDKFKEIITKYDVKIIAIGNGTASRESEEFVANNIFNNIQYVIVNEAGASVYSASEEAHNEFPNLHVEERSAISIARRLQDPLAELIKIDPKAIGVGQYQHDLPIKELDNSVNQVVETAVNQIGVNLNTTSIELLTHISGLNKTIAKNIINYRDENGEFNSRNELKKVPRLGPKAYEQAAGFLRIITGENVFDNTDIHPESYPLTKKILESNKLSVKDVGTKKLEILRKVDVIKLAKELNAGVQTIEDIIQSLLKPGRDVRDDLPPVMLRIDVLKMEDLKIGMKLKATIRNVTDFGAFADIGVKHDGLIHISKMSKKRVNHPSDIVSIGDVVDVFVVEIDVKRQRISLSMLPMEINNE